jgi:DNA-binding transcriptional regulator of glucitol operon
MLQMLAISDNEQRMVMISNLSERTSDRLTDQGYLGITELAGQIRWQIVAVVIVIGGWPIHQRHTTNTYVTIAKCSNFTCSDYARCGSGY